MVQRLYLVIGENRKLSLLKLPVIYIIIASTKNYRKLYRNVRNSERGIQSVERASLTQDASEPDQWSDNRKKIINNEVNLISYIADSTLRWQ
jgi:hypothetical protein